MVIKKGKAAKASRSKEKHVIQSNLCSNLKAIYFSKDKASFYRGIERMADSYSEALTSREGVQDFLEELKFRMDLLIDNKTCQTSRVRCLQSIVMCAIQLMKNGDLSLLDFIVDYCENLCHAESQVVRQYVCIIIRLLYEAANLSNDDFGTASILPDAQYRSLFAILKERWIDVREDVRHEAICALACIQQDPVSADHEEAVERSPRDMLMASLGDCSPDCRMEAVKRFIITDVSEIRLILNVLQFDTDARVKKAAILAVLSDNKFEEINSRTRMEVLEHLMAPAQQALKEWIADLLMHWIQLAAKAEENLDECVPDTQLEKSADNLMLVGTLHFLRHLDLLRKEQVCEMTLATAFRHLAGVFKNLTGLVNALTDSTEECLKRNNYRSLILESGNTLSEKALLLFHWRVLIELCCVEYADREDQKSICLFKLVPTMHAFAEFVTEFVESYAESQESPFRDNLRGGRRKLEDTRQFCLIQLLRILQCLDREPVGMESWKRLLFFLLTNVDIRLCQPLAKIVVESIMHFHFPGENDAEPALHEFCDTINTFMQADQQVFNASAMNASGRFSPSRGFVVDNSQNNAPIKSQMDEPTRNRSLLILNAMLRSGRFKSITAELQGLYDSILPDSFASAIADIRILALECLGIFSLLDEDFAKEHTCLIGQALLVDLKAVKLTCINVLTDLVLRYGYSNVARWYRRSDDEDPEENLIELDKNGSETSPSRRRSTDSHKSRDVIEKLIELSTGKCPDLSFSATECLCKWCLSLTTEDVTELRNVVKHILLLLFRDESKENPRQMACLSRFMPLFVGTSRRNQLLLSDAFLSAMKSLKEDDVEHELASIIHVDEDALSAYVVKMTSFYVLQENATDYDKGSSHSYLAKLLLTELGINSYDYYASTYCRMLSDLEINNSMDEEELKNLTFLCSDVYTPAFEDAKDAKHFNQFIKRLASLNDNVKVPQRTTRRAVANTPVKGGAETPFDGNEVGGASSTSTMATPQKRGPRGAVTPRTASAKKTPAASIATLTSEFSVGRKKTRRPAGAQAEKSRAGPRLARRPIMKRAAKEARSAYRADETIIEEDEKSTDNERGDAENYEIQEVSD